MPPWQRVRRASLQRERVSQVDRQSHGRCGERFHPRHSTSGAYGFISNPAYVPTTINLPIVNINTNGVPIVSKTTDVTGTIAITSPDGQTSYLPNSDDGDNTATFHVHGNTTALMPKLPYKVKLNTSLDLLGTMGLSCPYVTSKGKPVCDKSKSYVLLANYDDKTLLRDWAASALANAIPLGNGYLSSPKNSPSPSGTSTLMPWAPHSLFVELYVNGVYEGNYQLIEEVKVDSHRINITELSETDVNDDITGGYLMEIDHRGDAATVIFTPQGLPIDIQDPDFSPDPAVPQQTTYITDYMSAAENALFSSTFTDPTTGWRAYFDEASAVNFYIVNDLMGNVDGGDFGSSDYLYKAIDNPLIYMGPIWDFDISSGNANYAPIANPTVPWMQTAAPWYVQWFKDPQFKADVVTQWNALKNNGVFTSWLASIWNESATLQQSQQNNFGRWPMQGIEVWPNTEAVGSYNGEVQFLTTWLQLRMAYLDSQFNNTKPTATALAIAGGAFRNGVPASFTAQVTGGSSPTGAITFLCGGVPLGSAAIGAGGVATFTTSALPIGQDSLTAIYSGDANNALSASSPSTITVSAPQSATVVSVAGPAIAYTGDSTAITASVLSNTAGSVPTGTVAFSVDNNPGPVVALTSAGTATSSLTFSSRGTHTIQAVYSGDGNNLASSATIPVAVSVPAGLSVSGTDLDILAGTMTGNSSTITVTPIGGFTGNVSLSAAITSSPAGATLPKLSFASGSPLQITGGPEQASLTITTSAPVQANARHAAKQIFGLSGLASAAFLLVFNTRRRKWSALLGMALFAVALPFGLAGCAGGGPKPANNNQAVNPGTTPGVYVITVTATSGSLTAKTNINLQVR